jgi:hypothetical protein
MKKKSPDRKNDRKIIEKPRDIEPRPPPLQDWTNAGCVPMYKPECPLPPVLEKSPAAQQELAFE